MAALLAKNHRVFGIDLDSYAVKVINSGRSPIVEPFLPPLIRKGIDSGQLSAHSDYKMVTNTDMSLVIVPTPSTKGGAFTNKFVIRAVAEIGLAVRGQEARHVVVICSTVMPESCATIITETLEKYSGKKVGKDIGLVYSPEFIALGSVIHDMQNPAMVLIGESDEISGNQYEKLAPKGVPVRRMGLTSAEIAKISLNSYVTMKISFANTLGEICERIPGADASQITEAIGLDPRVGSPYIQPGGPFGGPCFPRDNRAFSVLASGVGVEALLAHATDSVNDRQVVRTIRHIESFNRENVGILGLTYKPGAAIFEESFGMKLAEELHKRKYTVRVFDPLAVVKPNLHDDISWTIDATQCFGNNMVTVLANPDRQLSRMIPDIFAPDAKNRSIVIDCWDYIPKGPWDDTHIIRLGKGQ